MLFVLKKKKRKEKSLPEIYCSTLTMRGYVNARHEETKKDWHFVFTVVTPSGKVSQHLVLTD